MAEQKIINTLVGVFVGAILAAALIPVALTQLATANLTGFSIGVPNESRSVDPAVIALFAVIGIAVIVVVVITFFKLI